MNPTDKGIIGAILIACSFALPILATITVLTAGILLIRSALSTRSKPQ